MSLNHLYASYKSEIGAIFTLMSNYYTNPAVLPISGYEIYYTRFADSILKDHFISAANELTSILSGFYINESQILSGGGGLSSITQALGGLLVSDGWQKEVLESEYIVRRTIMPSTETRILTSESHEVDHYKAFPQGSIGLEIEWNNKDPFYDRDLENFRKLHQTGELSIGIIVTRGASLQIELEPVFKRFLTEMYPFNIDTLRGRIDLSDKAKVKIKNFLDLPKDECIAKTTRLLYSSKFGTATTHMDKLLLRINRGLGNPCPLILIGIGQERLKP